MTPPLRGAGPPPPVDADTSTRERILVATAEVLGSSGITKLSLSDVATRAGVSRPTLYRWFGSKQDLLGAFAVWERHFYERAVTDASVGLPASQRLDAALRVIVACQHSYPGLRMVDVEPEHVIPRLAMVIPVLRQQFERLITGPDAAVAAAAVVRVAMSHYLVRSDDGDQFLAQLRNAAGLEHPDP
jgi:AcrR family transcriptional regulator